MKKIILIACLMFAVTQGQTYDTGDVMSVSHQNQSFDACYGDYDPTFKFADLNGALNDDGRYWVTFIDMAATW